MEFKDILRVGSENQIIEARFNSVALPLCFCDTDFIG